MKKVLILGVASVQHDAIEFLKNNYNDIEVHAIARGADGPGANAADVFTKINILEVDSVKKYILTNNIDVIYSVGSDLSMPVSTTISEELGLPHFVSNVTAKICNNKDLMRESLGLNFKGNIPFQPLSSIKQFDVNRFPKFPLFLKPADSQGQRGITKIDQPEEISQYFDYAQSFSRSGIVIVEQYIEGDEVSVNGYMVNGKLAFCEISDRITWNKYEGLIQKHQIPTKQSGNSDSEVFDLLQRVANKLCILNGPIYAQIKIEKDMPYLIEVTPRLDGCHMWKLIKVKYGFDILRLTFDHLLFNDVSELSKIESIVGSGKCRDINTLEFLCQEPDTKAHYPSDFKIGALEYYQYYQEGDTIRAVNGKYEKIGYKIY